MNAEPSRDDKARVFESNYGEGKHNANYYAFERRNYFSCEVCRICLEKLPDLKYPVTFTGPEENNNVELLNCTNQSLEATKQCCHKFHHNCISEWLSTHNNCPVCRRVVESRRIIQKCKFDLVDADFVGNVTGGRIRTIRKRRVVKNRTEKGNKK